jgi:NADH:ubiquinone oxidoreductase subunit K
MTTTIFLLGALCLLAIGLCGLLTRRNLIQIIIAMQILAKAAVFALVLAGKISGQINLGQSLAVTVIVADTIVAVVALALAVQVHRRLGTLDVKALSTLRG